MQKPRSNILEGLFAVNKPRSITSAQVVRNLQRIFDRSTLFASSLDAMRQARRHESAHQRRRRKQKHIQVKIGHGGTLDPMATGVLILGVGRGTKQLQSFIDCYKSYEATILFGTATDTYDITGNLTERRSFEHITKDLVAEKLNDFRGSIKQQPPLYSALWIDGKRLHEYAREGKALPREIEERSVTVQDLELIEWLDGDDHDYLLSAKGKSIDSQDDAQGNAGQKRDDGENMPASSTSLQREEASGTKRKRSTEDDTESQITSKKLEMSHRTGKCQLLEVGAGENMENYEGKSHPKVSTQTSTPQVTQSKPPAFRLRMTVSSGFYVRSLAHDLGKSLDSAACLCALTRTKQSNFTLGENVIEYKVLEQGEDVWSPLLSRFLNPTESPMDSIAATAEEGPETLERSESKTSSTISTK